MACQKETKMVLKVDLQCCCCSKKIKKILCKFPEIQNQEFDEKQNSVTITVVCCSPEKFRDKLYCKGGKIIICIKIIPPPPPSPPKPEPVQTTPPPPPTKPEPVQITLMCCGPCYEGCYHGHGRPKPCYCGCGRSAPCYDHGSMPKPCYCGCGRSAPCNYGGGYYEKSCSASVCYFTEENPSGCTTM
uniref:HMA domain-containing protein n=1 Tax=Davidia involucrata TaxID=16924 RepID=A0A5B6ZM43_DAVIN